MWDTKYRPLKFSDVLGQDGSVQLLKARLRNGTALDTSYVFSGGHGQGKTTIARILARAMLCTNLLKDDPEPCNECDNCKAILDETSGAVVELDAASRGTIENVRGIVDDLPFAVFGAAKRVYVFDEAHRMSRDSQDVLLKPLEDKKMVGIFCTTEPEKIRGTIRSRCEHYTVRKITREDILVRVNWVLDQEGVKHEDDAVLTVIDYSGGHTRDVLNRLEMIAQMGAVTLANTRQYLRLSAISTYYETLLALDDPAKAVSLIERACEQVLPEEAANGLAEAAMNSFRLANGMHADFVYVDRAMGKKVYDKFGINTIKLAEFFLRSRYVTRVSLTCDVLAWAHAAGNLSAASVIVTQPVMTQVVMSVGAASNEPPLAPAVSAPVSTPVAASAVSIPATIAVAPPSVTSSTAPKSNGNGARHTPVGDLGSGDTQALTSLDSKLVPPELPRMRTNAQGSGLHFDKALQDVDDMVMNPVEWRRKFEHDWSQGLGRRG